MLVCCGGFLVVINSVGPAINYAINSVEYNYISKTSKGRVVASWCKLTKVLRDKRQRSSN